MRIVSDGTPRGTRIYADDGEDLTRKLPLRAINLRLNTAHSSAELYVAEGTEIDVQVAREHARLFVNETEVDDAPLLTDADAVAADDDED